MVIVDEARGVGLGLGKEREKWDTLTCGGSRFLVVEEDVSFAEGSDFWGRCIGECTAGCAWV